MKKELKLESYWKDNRISLSIPRVISEFLASLDDLRGSLGKMPGIIEIHEGAVTDRESILRLRDILTDLDMKLAYNDFSAGQAHLMKLIDVKPYYVKVDIQLIRNLHKVSCQHQQVVSMLVNMVRYLDVTSVVEKVEYDEEAKVCLAISFDLG